MLHDRVFLDLQSAMKQKEELHVSTLRMLRAAMGNAAIEKRKQILSDDEVIEVIGKEVKKRKEAIESFEKGRREDLAEKEKTELQILERYLPAALSDSELAQIVRDVISKSGARSKSEMGKVMKEVLSQVKGRADGKRVSELVSRSLG